MKVAFGLLAIVICTVAANILMKMGAMAPVHARLFGLANWKTVLGLGCFGVGGLVYAWILSYMPLNVAQSILAVQFIAVIAASAIILSEPIPLVRWLGIVLIFIGIFIVSLTGRVGHVD